MAIYRFQPDSLIDSLQIRVNDTGGARAYLHAREGASGEELKAIQAALTAHGWKTVPTLHDGQATLEVRGFRKPEDALALLSSHGWTQGTPTVQAQDDDTPTKEERHRNSTLKYAGALYVLGDLCFFRYAHGQYKHDLPKNNPATNFFNKLDIGAGVGYAMGSASLLTFGSRDQSLNTIQNTTKKIHAYLRKEQVGVEDNTPLDNYAYGQKKGIIGTIGHTLAKYPSETLNTVYVGVGALLGTAAMYRAIRAHQVGNIAERNDDLWDIGLGAITASSALAGLLIKEKKPGEEKEKRHGLGAVADWIQEKPLRATGYGFMIATLFHAKSTWGKYQKGDEMVRKYAKYRGGFVAANLGAEALLTLSSKGHGTGVKPDESIDQTVISATAELLLRQPEEKRMQLLDQLAGYMASSDLLGGKADVIAERLVKQMQAMEHNPWLAQAMPMGLANPEAANDNPPEKPATMVSQGQSQGMLHEGALVTARR